MIADNMENFLPQHFGSVDRIILFDGVCKLCNAWSRFIIRFDTQKRFRLCAVQSDEGRALLEWFGYPVEYFETMLLIHDNRALERSDSFLMIMSELPAPWCWLRVLRLFPRRFRDWFYDRIALNRYRIFGRYGSCLLAVPDHEERFFKCRSPSCF